MAFSEDDMIAAQEQINKFAQNLEELNKTLTSISSINSNYSRTVNQSSTAIKTNTQDIDTSSTALKNYEKVVNRTTESEEKRKQVIQQASSALDSFIGATLSTEKGLTKYTDTLTSSINTVALAFSALAIAVGAKSPVVIAITAFASLLNMLVSGSLKMSQSSLEARDALVKVGAAGAFTAEDIAAMGESVKVSTEELEVLIGPLKKLGVAVITLSNDASGGMVRFTQAVSKLTDEEIQQYRRVGLGYNELTEAMSDYVSLQYSAGIQLNSRFKTEDQLKKASLEYVDNLLELSRLTGKDIDTIKKEQQAALMEENLQIRLFRLQEEGQGLLKSSNEADRERGRLMLLEAEQTKELISELATAAPGIREGVTEYLAAGGAVVGQASSKLLLQFGEEFLPGIKGMLSQGMLDENERDKIVQSTREMMRELLTGPIGEVMTLNTEALRVFGVGAEATAQIIGTTQQVFNEARNLIEQQLESMRTVSAGLAANTQAATESTSRFSRLVAQDLYQTVNGPVLTALDFLADAARAAARALSFLSSEGRAKLREEDEREKLIEDQNRQRELLNDLINQNKGVESTDFSQVIDERISSETNKLNDLLTEYKLSIGNRTPSRTNIGEANTSNLLDSIEAVRILIKDLEIIRSQSGVPTASTSVEIPTSNPVPITPSGYAELVPIASATTAEQNLGTSLATNMTTNPVNRDEISLLGNIQQTLVDMIGKLDRSNDIQERILRNTV